MGAMQALERMAALDPWDLCKEAKIEKCRATRDLRSCGRPVQHLLTSCGHACLCIECSQRCDVCPVCRTPVTTRHPILRLRLYDECVQGGLLPPARESDFHNSETDGPYWTLDAWRLCSFFDVAIDHNLASVVCHYVADVCMDETAVSSDAVISMLLDGAVVKEWCKRTLTATIRILKDIYDSKSAIRKMDALDKHERRLQGVCAVLETLETPLDPSSASLQELHELLDGARLVLQHLEVMSWCIRHQFLENVNFCYSSVVDWKLAFQERKQAALYRAWPDYAPGSGRFGPKPSSTLFIEDALQNIGFGEPGNEYVVHLLRRKSSLYTFDREVYPPESVSSAVDLLFLSGSPELFLAKKATFLYYLYDRHWGVPTAEHETSWDAMIDDYANCFSIPRQSMLESFVFYLLDNNEEAALEKACHLLPEIVSPNLHQKICRVLLERNRAEVAYSVLKSSGRFPLGVSSPAPLVEAVTAIRLWIKCGLLMEAYKYQQRHCSAVKAEARTPRCDEDELGPRRDWAEEQDVLVGEICLLCIQLNVVDRMLELPWQQSDEEKVLKKCLFQQAVQDPGSSSGSLLVMFYLQRCRFTEASAVHHRLLQLEQQWLANYPDGDSASKLRSMCEYRTQLLGKCLEQLPETERDRVIEDETVLEEQPSSILSVLHEKQQPEFDFGSQTSSRISDGPAATTPFSPAPSNLLLKKSQYISAAAEDASPNGPSSWGRPSPSFLKTKSAMANNSPMYFTPMKSPLVNGMVATSNGVPSELAPRPSPGFSPLLGKRLRYESDLQGFRHFPNGGDAASGGTTTPTSAKKESSSPAGATTHPMVLTW